MSKSNAHKRLNQLYYGKFNDEIIHSQPNTILEYGNRVFHHKNNKRPP